MGGLLSLYRFSVRRVSSRIRAGNLVSYAGSPWRVLRVLGAEAVLLRSDTGAEVSVDPLAIRFPDACPAALPSLPVTDDPGRSRRFSGQRRGAASASAVRDRDGLKESPAGLSGGAIARPAPRSWATGFPVPARRPAINPPRPQDYADAQGRSAAFPWRRLARADR